MHDGLVWQKSWNADVIRMQFDSGLFAPPDFDKVGNAENPIDEQEGVETNQRDAGLLHLRQVRFDFGIDRRIVGHEKNVDVSHPPKGDKADEE